MPADEAPRPPGRNRLDALEARIVAARQSRRPKRDQAHDMSAAALAWRMVTELVLGVMIGAGVGWGIDSVSGTLPLFLLVFGLLGFAAGVRTMLRSAEEVRRRGAQHAAGAGHGAETRADGAKDAGADGAQRRS